MKSIVDRISKSPKTAGRRADVVRSLLAGLSAALLLAPCKAHCGPTLDQLRNDPKLTPESFVHYFRNFRFKLGDDLQTPEKFLSSEEGDCDDFASLAATILKEKKYTTRMIAVFMGQQTHVVCYVAEAHGFLDFNRRADASPVQASDGRLEDVAEKVAAYFRAPWRYVAEVTYHAGVRHLGHIAFHPAS